MIYRHSVPILYSEDIDRSIDYYTRVLCFNQQWKWDEPPTFGGVSKDLVEIFFCKKGQGNPGTWLSVMVDDVDEFFETVKTNGAIIRSEPEDMDWGIREMLVQDPDGHMIRFGHGIGRDRKKSGALPEGIQILERKPTVEEYRRLVSVVGWHQKEERQLEKLLSAVLFSVVAVDEASDAVIGTVLMIGDHASFYYIKDMMVDPRWQNRRVGTALMQKVHDWISLNGEKDALVGLYTGENLAPFYKQFGFRESFGMSRRIVK